MGTCKKEIKLENLNFKNDIFDKNKSQRDYDKEPLILRNYTSWALFIHFLLIFAF